MRLYRLFKLYRRFGFSRRRSFSRAVRNVWADSVF